ncbi:uncharacterized protein F5147DRAFT_671115 [Suillus discolor]|uniref:Fe2OG dioxygenase domain-containing protein n=1 Tax=Suillus discolor TaxID=1912936 RepID=A0A9P7FFK4_9AGAM|nr:uncharacterized protein F5147DRAFT_671115 [Suillus discolor]KAG2117085.1 hypothetical protein F5147DRAFT_671115 [Suillus discolor]
MLLGSDDINMDLLAEHHLQGTSAVFYIPNFISEDEEQYLLRKIKDSPKQKWKMLNNRRLQLWGGEVLQKNILFRQEFPAFLNDFPDVLGRLRLLGAFNQSPHKGPNHVILNEYHPGQGIMPHEDGPSYHPVVATISLGSHTIFHYYQYNKDKDSLSVDPGSTRMGRSVNPAPSLSLFLEPRSVVVTTGELYTTHLHGIDEVDADTFTGDGFLLLPNGSHSQIVNRHMIKDETVARMIESGGTVERTTRYSLTCRDVEKVASGRVAGVVNRT